MYNYTDEDMFNNKEESQQDSIMNEELLGGMNCNYNKLSTIIVIEHLAINYIFPIIKVILIIFIDENILESQTFGRDEL